MRNTLLSVGVVTILATSGAYAQAVTSPPATPNRTVFAGARTQAQPEPAAPAAAPASLDKLTLYFNAGSTTIRPQDLARLDQAARLYRDAHPIVMIVAGGTDSVGSAAANLSVSEARAHAVVQGLVARGIPVEHFQLLAKGKTDPAVPTADGVAEPANRVVEIRWR